MSRNLSPRDEIANWFETGAKRRPDPAPKNGGGTGNRPSDEWSSEEIALLRDRWAEQMTRHEISDEIKVKLGTDRTPKAVANKASALGLKTRPRAALKRPVSDRKPEILAREGICLPPTTKKRRCLSCAEFFDSDWVGNRICNGCKNSGSRPVD
ncbi:MAG: hypothetical protein ING19_09525 [Azospirillum sp.]|nr:hypothetical protein [Azospirillum sp.]